MDEALPTLDPKALDMVRNVGGDALVKRLIDTFLEAAPPRVDRLVRAAAGGDMDAVAMSAHSLKSMAGNVGAHRLQAAAVAVEAAARSADVEAVMAGTDELVEQLHRVQRELSEVLPSR